MLRCFPALDLSSEELSDLFHLSLLLFGFPRTKSIFLCVLVDQEKMLQASKVQQCHMLHFQDDGPLEVALRTFSLRSQFRL